jgi:hypothetical protein
MRGGPGSRGVLGLRAVMVEDGHRSRSAHSTGLTEINQSSLTNRGLLTKLILHVWRLHPDRSANALSLWQRGQTPAMGDPQR